MRNNNSIKSGLNLVEFQGEIEVHMHRQTPHWGPLTQTPVVIYAYLWTVGMPVTLVSYISRIFPNIFTTLRNHPINIDIESQIK